MNQIRVGFIGCGEMANLHQEALEKIPEARIVAVYDRDKAKAINFSNRIGAKATSNADEILTDPTIDSVYILTRHDSHFDFVIRAAEARKAVFCEKPLALTKEHASTIAKRVKKTRIPLMVGFNLRWSPVICKAMEWLEQFGGSIFALQLSFVTSPFLQGWGGLPTEGGGVLHCLGSHALDLALFLLRCDSIRFTTSHSRLRLGKPYLSDTAAIILQAEKGVLATLLFHDHAPETYTSYDTGEQSNLIRAELYGDSWAIVIDNLSRIRLYNDEKNQEVSINNIDRIERYGILDENKHFIQCLLNNHHPSPNVDDGVRAVELVELAARSADISSFMEWKAVGKEVD